MRKLRLVIAESQSLYRDALAALLAGGGDIELVGLARDMHELRLIGRRVVPDVVVVGMFLVCGEDIALIRDQWPNAALVRVGEGSNPNGAVDHFVPITASGGELLRVIRASHVCDDIPALPRRDTTALTERELTIVELLADGLSNKEIAHRLGIGAQNVKNHISHLLEKLGFVDRTQLAVYAVEHNLAHVHPDRDPSA